MNEKKEFYITDVEDVQVSMHEIVNLYYSIIEKNITKINKYTMHDIKETISVIPLLNELEDYEQNKYVQLANEFLNAENFTMELRFNLIMGLTRLYYYYPEIVSSWDTAKVINMAQVYEYTPNNSVVKSEELILNDDLFENIMSSGNIDSYKQLHKYHHYLEHTKTKSKIKERTILS